MSILNWVREVIKDNNYPPNYPPCPQTVDEAGRICFQQSDVNRWTIGLRRILAKSVPHLGYGNCKCCGLPWWVVEGKSVSYSPSSGIFPICTLCWQQLGTSDNRWPYYRDLIRQYHPEYEQAMKEAVVAAGGGWEIR